ncbi:hypothetical protein GCM10023176_38710 [Micromonospora coerulea]|uniref:Uncharacterized protein n=1 Tax=Micromonospora coerulea TaxID=47856 RepID=A0ABP8SSF6_9ACTN
MTALVIAAAIVVASVGVRVAASPVRPAALARFSSRHGLIAPASPALVTYLAVTRRWRTVGVSVALVVSLVARLDEQRVQVETVALVAGWLAGALVAEQRLRSQTAGPGPGATRHVAPRLLTWASAGVGALGVIVTAAILIIGPSGVALGDVALWGVASVVAVLVTMVVVHAIAFRRADGGPRTEAAAIASSSMHVITAGGVAVGLLCLVRALGVARDGLFGQTQAAVDGIGFLWSVAALVLAGALISAGWHRPVPIARPQPRAWFAMVSAIGIVGSAGWLGYGLWRDRPPYPASVINARTTVVLTDFEHFDSAAASLGIDGLTPLLTTDSDRAVIGRLDYDVPPEADGADRYYVVVIDKQTDSVAPLMFDHDGGGWSGFLDNVPRQHPWLSALSPRQSPSGHGLSVSRPANQTGPIVFTALFPGKGPMTVDRLTVAIIFVGPDHQIYWTLPVPVHPAGASA